MDYGAPVGYRLALRRPDSVEALIVQNGNAYEEGLLEFWDPIKKYWNDPTIENREALSFLVDPNLRSKDATDDEEVQAVPVESKPQLQLNHYSRK